jgi:hypothetical protein
VRGLSADVLEPSLSIAFRSDDTPAIHSIIESSFDKAPNDFKLDFLNTLRHEPFARSVMKPEIFDEAEVSSKDIADLVSALVTINPEIFHIVARQYARFPRVLLDLDTPIRAGILTNMARSRGVLLESLQEKESFVPKVEEVTKEAATTELADAAPTPRYAVVRFFAEQELGVRGDEFSANQVFQENRWYQAEVSIELKPAGVVPVEEPQPIRVPKQDARVDILVTAESTDFEITPRAAILVLPPSGESTEPAPFRIRPRRHSTAVEDRLGIRFRLFFKFNLLQVLIVRGGALPAIGDLRNAWQPAPLDLVYGIQVDANDFDLLKPCALHIAIEPEQQQYQMTFTLKRDGIDDLAFAGTMALSAAELESAIAGVRKSLFWVCSSPTMGEQVEGLDWEYRDHLKELATRGCKLWSLLFDPGRGDDMSVIGEWLRNNPLPEESTIQVSVDPGAASFVFSWSLLYDHACLDDSGFNEKGFWGMRYVIEQKPIKRLLLAGTAAPLGEVEIGAMYWNFAQTPEQKKYLLALMSSTKNTSLSSGGLIDDAAKALECLQECDSDIVYFYTHGYTGLPDGGRYGVTIEDFLDLYNKLPEDSATKKAWKYVYEGVQKKQYQSDQSWIELTNGRLLLDELYQRVKKLTARPFVILNMCDSAQITPALSISSLHVDLAPWSERNVQCGRCLRTS